MKADVVTFFPPFCRSFISPHLVYFPSIHTLFFLNVCQLFSLIFSILFILFFQNLPFFLYARMMSGGMYEQILYLHNTRRLCTRELFVCHVCPTIFSITLSSTEMSALSIMFLSSYIVIIREKKKKKL